MDRYKQLQEFIFNCFANGLDIRKISASFASPIITMGELGVKLTDEYGSGPFYYSYHDLFSTDSGIMEFVKWKYAHKTRIATHDEVEYEDMNLLNNGYFYKSNEAGYHYMTMGPMTSDMKIEYFLENALYPTTTDDK